MSEPIDLADDLWTLAHIAKWLHMPAITIQKKIVTRPGFPAADNSGWPQKWRASDTRQFFKTGPELPSPPKATRSLAHLSERNAHLYRHFDECGQLLYVGISLSALSRTVQHRRDSHWFREVCTITVEHFATREQALAAETLAIRAEKPLHNKQGVE